MCAVLPSEGENLFYVRLNFSSQIKRRVLIDTGSCANALLESLFKDFDLTNPKSLTLEQPFLILSEWPLVKKFRSINKQKFQFRSDLTISKIAFQFYRI